MERCVSAGSMRIESPPWLNLLWSGSRSCQYWLAAIRERDARTLIEEAKTPQFERDFRRLSLERALEVWELANDEERKKLRPILLKKKSQQENRVPAQRAPLQEKLRSALSERTAPQPVIPAALRKLLGVSVGFLPWNQVSRNRITEIWRIRHGPASPEANHYLHLSRWKTNRYMWLLPWLDPRSSCTPSRVAGAPWRREDRP